MLSIRPPMELHVPSLFHPYRVPCAHYLRAKITTMKDQYPILLFLLTAIAFPSVAQDVRFCGADELRISTLREMPKVAEAVSSREEDLERFTAEFVRDERATRSGFVYQTIGEVKILAIKDDLYIGSVTKAYDVIKRGAKVYPLLPKVSDIIPTAATKAIEGLIVTSTTRTTKSHAQYQFIHLDRGFEDGVQIGNVFRVYEYNDPTTKEPITKSDFLIKADALVIHATAQFSTAMILRSIKSVERSDFGITLTDVSELERLSKDRSRQFGNGGPTQGDPIDEELDELDALDRSSGEGIGNNERKEIEQLDQWDKARGDSGSAPSNSGQPSEPTPQSNPTVEQFIVPDNNASTADDAALDKDLTPTPPASNVVPDLTPAPPNTDGGNAYNPTTISTPNAPAPDLAPIEAPPPLPEPDPVTPTTTPAPAADSTTPSTVEMSEPAPVSEE